MLQLDLQRSHRNYHIKENYPAPPLGLPRVLHGVSLLPGHVVCTLDSPSSGRRVGHRGVGESPPTAVRERRFAPSQLEDPSITRICTGTRPAEHGMQQGISSTGHRSVFLITIETSKHQACAVTSGSHSSTAASVGHWGAGTVGS